MAKPINRPITGSEMMQLLPGVPLITYDKLKHMRTIDDVIGPKKMAVILYMLAQNYGHYVCIYVRNNKLCFFCSYGSNPDNLRIFQGVPADILIAKNETFSWLSRLMLDSEYPKLSYNDIRYQKANTSTCGRHVAVRLWNLKLDDDKYDKFINSTKFTPDELVTVLTENILKGQPYNERELIIKNLKKNDHIYNV
jgi:hypothetical protein